MQHDLNDLYYFAMVVLHDYNSAFRTISDVRPRLSH